MCLRNTVWALLCACSVVPAWAQAPADWRRIGNSALDLSLPSPATGPIERVWYSEDGSRLFARASADRTFVTTDFETWTSVGADQSMPVAPEVVASQTRPEAGARVRGQRLDRTRLYAIGRFVYRSDNAGASWASLTNFKGNSILGDGMLDLAISPRDTEELVVATAAGLWRSLDGGQSWSGLNDAFPNIPVRRIISTPHGSRGVRVAVGAGGSLIAFEWQPGEKQAWRPVQDSGFDSELGLQRALSQTLGSRITATAAAGDYIYAGSADGRLWSSSDRGRTWIVNPDQFPAAIEAIHAEAREPRLALAALGERFANAPANARAPHVLRTINGGAFWDDLTANLPDTAAHGITADRPTGAVYAATDRGVFVSYQDLVGAGPPTAWSPLGDSAPAGRAEDVQLDPFGHQLYIALDGFGVYAAAAPHRLRAPRIASAADFTDRPVAPGALVTVFGANIRSATAGQVTSPVLASSATRSEIQIPFEAKGSSLSLAVDASSGPMTFGLPLQTAAPAIFVDVEGAPMVLDADTGVLLDPMRPAHSNARLQILATGLGQVRPQWPSGVPAPADNPPSVIAPVRAFLDRAPVEVTRAVLAPYVGFYLIEIQIPKLVNYGPAELYLEVDGQPSNRVRVYIEP